MTRRRHTDAVGQGLLRPLLGQTIVGLGHVVLGDPTNTRSSRGGIATWLSLIFTLQDGRQFELGEYFPSSDEPEPQFFPHRIDAERLACFGPYWAKIGRIWVEAIRDLDPPPPWSVAAISEVWVPMEQGADPLTSILWGERRSEDPADRPALLALDLHENVPCSLATTRALVERAALWHPSVLYRLYDPPLRRIKLMADYGIALWTLDYGAAGDIDPQELPMSPATRARLYAWAHIYTTWQRTNATPVEAERAAFELEGVTLWYLLREELAGRYVASYWSEKHQCLIDDPSDI